MHSKIQTTGVALLLLTITFSCSNAQKDKKADNEELPNIVLLMGDDHGWDEVGYNGHPFVKTPVLDEMVKEMQAELRKWQESVLNSLTGADY
jgi:hypothetical protein